MPAGITEIQKLVIYFGVAEEKLDLLMIMKNSLSDSFKLYICRHNYCYGSAIICRDIWNDYLPDLFWNPYLSYFRNACNSHHGSCTEAKRITERDEA